MPYILSCTVCTLEREVDTLERAFDLEDEHIETWGDEHIIEIDRLE